ncbi:membrane protein [Pseudosulfitobacter pseudonitzschiae]|uniref:Membrane protein n=2 Tax=Rhodobacterales TaxID=204455 RepID=A0A221JZJ8_9RHOB|nr:membrane protein [Pseudosulfitobacter pseudonitzschiae]
MDRALRIPLIGVRVGLDSILGLVPGVGDLLALGPAGYIVVQARRIGAPPSLVARMGVNIGIDAVIGSIPLVGDLFDIGWKANSRNVKLLRAHVEAQEMAVRP